MEFTGPKPSGTSRQSKPITERRRSTRLVVHSPAYASLNGSQSAKPHDLNEILDITEDGASIQTSSPLEVDRNLNLSLDLSETKTRINAVGRVIWSNSAGRAGIRFSKLSAPTLRQLKEWLMPELGRHRTLTLTPSFQVGLSVYRAHREICRRKWATSCRRMARHSDL
jgi:PilZ domain